MKRELDFSKARRGALVPEDPNKTRATIWLDKKLVDYLQSIVDRAGGGSYEDFVNELLCQRVLSSGREVRGIKSRLSKNGTGQDKLFTALTILDTGEAPTPHSGRAYSTRRATRQVQHSKKTHGRRAVRLFDFDT
jgi:hypothetical protein